MVSRKTTCVKLAQTCLAAALALGTAETTLAAVVDLGGASVTKTGAEFKAAYNNNTIENGTVTVSELAGNTGTYTIGANAVVQCSVQQYFNGDFTINIVNGGEYKQTGSYFVMPFRNGNDRLTIDGGKFTCTSTTSALSRGGMVNFGYVWNNQSSSKGKDVSAVVVMKNGAELSISSGNLQLSSVKSNNEAGSPVKTSKTDLFVTNSTITCESGAIVLGCNLANWLSDWDNSYVRAVFGPGSDMTVGQIYANGQYPAPSVTFDGATIHWTGNGNSFIGHNSGVGDMYTIDAGGLTVDIPSGKALTCDSNASSLKGLGGITKIGDGSITWNRVSSNGSQGMTFTGPLVVSNGTWSSSVGYAASAFKVDGANSTLALSGALTAANVALAATDGGTLTLAGATLTDASPDLTLAGGGTTDYFTRDGAVAAYSFDSLTLDEGAVLDLGADATGMDVISATTTNITATAANPVTINLNFTAAPAAGETFTFFATDDAAKFTVTPKLGSLTVPHEISISDGILVMTVTADDYVWNGSQTNWGDADAWTKGGAAATWSDGNNAIFNTANAMATLAADAAASKVEFSADATVDGTATLTAPVVAVASGVSATISAPTAGTLSKTGAGTLVLGSSRTAQTTVSEGTFAMVNGATVVPANLTLGTDPEKPVTFDYGGQALSVASQNYLVSGTDVTLLNGEYNMTSAFAGTDANLPATLTIGTGAVFSDNDRFSLNTTAGRTINVRGGSMISKANNNNWIMQNSRTGALAINVTDGGLLEFGGDTYLLTCRDGADTYESPELHMKVVGSTVRVKNGKSIRSGFDGNMKSSAKPEFTLAATNSIFDIGYGLYIGNDPAEGRATEGFYKTDFENCVITAKEFRVHNGRPLNSARLNNSRLVFNAAGDITAYDGDAKWIAVDAGGLTIDNQTFNCNLNANLGGSGTVTKVGTGKLSINTNQTATAALVCEEGETYVERGVSVARAITVKNGAKFTTKGTGQVMLANIALEDGAELRVDGYDSGVVPIAVTTLTLPANGTVALTKNNNFSQGKYRILEKTGIAVADVQDKLVPATTDSLAYSWSVEGNTLVLTVGNPTGFAWTGFAGDGKMSTPGNWLGNVAPGAGDPADFSAVNVATTVNADIDATLGAATLGSAVVTFTGSLTAASFSDTSKVAVGADSTVTLDGDLEFTSGNSYITHKVGDGGAFVVTGTIRATDSANVLPYEVASSGWIVAKGLENAETTGDKWNFRLNNSNVAKWVVGEDGFSGTQYFWSFNNANSDTTIKADADFTIATWLSVGTSNGKGVTLDTSGRTDPAANYTITANCGFVGVKPLTVKGGGTFLCNYTPTKVDNKGAFSGAVAVSDTATLAINPGKYPTTGEITVNSGTTLQVAQSGMVTLGGNLTFKDGAALGFNYTTRDVPVLDLTNKTVTFNEGETTNVVVRISSTDGKRGRGGPHALTSGGNFADATVTLAEGYPNWVKGVSVVDGNIVIDINPSGLTIFIK